MKKKYRCDILFLRKEGTCLHYGKAKKIDVVLLQIFLFAVPFLYGGFYEFTAYIAQIFLLTILLVKIIKEKNFRFYLNYNSIVIAVISLGYLFTCIYAIDKGMALLGFLKFTVPLTFLVLCMQYEEIQRKEMLKAIPISGVVMIVLSLAFRYLPFLPNEFYLPNGRMGGFFQYSNTFALFLLICIVSITYCEGKIFKKLGFIAVLLAGILLSGSRAVFILTILNFIFILIKFKDIRKPLIALIGCSILAIITYVAITKNFNTIGRFLTTSVNSSTLLGRILYYKDAFFTVLKHPFGLGYMGYSYIQPQIQTGVYNILYVHNEYLQLALDIGIIPMMLFIFAIVKNMLEKRNDSVFKQILITIAIHIFIDFDLQFMSIFIIFVLMLDLYSGKILKIKWRIAIAIILPILFIYVYFGIVTFLNYINKNEVATKMYPFYTEANIALAYEYSKENQEKANIIATKILQTNSYSNTAYNIKALYYMNNQNWNLMLYNKQKALENEKYEMSSYEEYILMLSAAIDYYTRSDDMESATNYIKLVVDVPSKIQEIKDKTSSLAYKLKDTPSFELSNETKRYIYKMSLVLED